MRREQQRFSPLSLFLIFSSFFPVTEAHSCGRASTGRARQRKVASVKKTSALTSTRADLGGSRSSRECSGVTGPRVCSGAAGRLTMRSWLVQMWETFLPAHGVVQKATFFPRNNLAGARTHAQLANAWKQVEKSGERVANSAVVSVCHSELRCAWGHTEKGGGGWTLLSSLRVTSFWTNGESHETKDSGASTFARAHWRSLRMEREERKRRRRGAEVNREKEEKKIGLNRILNWLY